MQVQIRNPIAVEVDAADDKGSVSFHFFTAAEHQAVVTIGRDLLPDLIEQLEEIVSAEAKPRVELQEPEAKQLAPQPAAPAIKQPVARDFSLFGRTMPPANDRDIPLPKPKEPPPAHQPILRALLQA